MFKVWIEVEQEHNGAHETLAIGEGSFAFDKLQHAESFQAALQTYGERLTSDPTLKTLINECGVGPIARLLELLDEDVFTDAPERAETVRAIGAISASLSTTLQHAVGEALAGGPPVAPFIGFHIGDDEPPVKDYRANEDPRPIFQCPFCDSQMTPQLVSAMTAVNTDAYMGGDEDRILRFDAMNRSYDGDDPDSELHCSRCCRHIALPDDWIVED